MSGRDDDELILRLRKEAKGRPWPDLGRFSGGPKANARPIDVKGLDRARVGEARCRSRGRMNVTIGGGPLISPPAEIRCVRRQGHEGSHYGYPD
jgi:hypothetical protein